MKSGQLARESPAELEVARTDGSFLYDTHRRRYIDFVMGWCVGNLGWRHPAPWSAARRFNGPDYVYPGYDYKPWHELARLLTAIAPGRLTRCFRATGGSEAVDLALQAAKLHTGREKFVAVEGAYHGNTLAAIDLPERHTIKPPLDERALQRLETQLKRRDVAAFIFEPISINLGVMVPTPPFMEALPRLCRKYGTLVIADEVATGFGRTGTLFASEQFDLAPDLMCVAKAMTGGAGGIGAVIASPAVAQSMEDEKGSFYSTYGWHPRSVDAAIATIRYLSRHKTRLLRSVATMSDYFRQRLGAMTFGRPVRLHVRGLAIGLEFEDEDYADTLQQRCRRRGLLVSTEDSSLLLLPSLMVTRAIAKAGLDILERCV